MNIKFRAWCPGENKMYFSAYQKVLGVLLCEDDHGTNEGKGLPVKEAAYEDCILMQSTGIADRNGTEIFEGDIVRIYAGDKIFEGEVGEIPDMYKSRGLHPAQGLLEEMGLQDQTENLQFEVISNRYQKPSV